MGGLACARRRHEIVVVIEAGGDAMHGADEGALSAAHHAEPDAAALAESLRCSMAILSLLYFSPSARARFASCQ